MTEEKADYWDEKARIKWSLTYFFGSMLVYSTRTSMSVCVASMSLKMGWNKQTSGTALSSFFFGYVMTNILGGYFADKYGGERMILYSVTVWGTITILLPYFSHSQTFLYNSTFSILAARFLTGCGQGFFFPSFAAITTKHVSVSERSMVSGFSTSGCTIGTIATGFFGSFLIEAFGWESVFILVGGLSLLWIYIYRIILQSENVMIMDSYQTSCLKSTNKIPLRTIISKPAVWAMLVSSFCNGYAFYNLLSWTPVYFHDAFPESKGWVFNVVPWLASFLVQNISGYYANNIIKSGVSVTFLRKMYAAVLFLGSTVFSLLLNAVETFQQALFVMTLMIGVGGFNACSLAQNPQDLLPKQSGALFGVANMVGALGGSIGVYLTGCILESTTNWSSIFFTNATVSLFGFIVFQVFGSGKPIDE